MRQPNEPHSLSHLPSSRRTASISLAFMTPSLQSLIRAVELGADERWDLALIDIERVEAVWEMLDAFSTSHGSSWR